MCFFVSTKFGSKVDFLYAIFDSEANFESAHFDSVVDFSKAKFNYLNLDDITLPDFLLFEGISTEKIIDLTKSKLGRGKQICYINLFDAPIEKIKMRYDNFRVYKPNDFKVKHHLNPENLNQTFVYEKLTNVYEGLLKNFKDHGYLVSYETLDKEYQEFKFTENPDDLYVGKLLNFINKYWNDYGYDKTRIWLITLLSFIFFAVINWFRFPHLITKVYSIAALKEIFLKYKTHHEYKAKHSKYPSINVRMPLLAVYYTALIFFGFKLNIEKLNFRQPVSVFYIFLQFTIGLICLAYLANFVISSTLIGS